MVQSLQNLVCLYLPNVDDNQVPNSVPIASWLWIINDQQIYVFLFGFHNAMYFNNVQHISEIWLDLYSYIHILILNSFKRWIYLVYMNSFCCPCFHELIFYAMLLFLIFHAIQDLVWWTHLSETSQTVFRLKRDILPPSKVNKQ